jgi:hypothetical protein
MKDEPIGKTLKSKNESTTEWPKLAQRSDAGIRAGIRADSYPRRNIVEPYEARSD